MAPVTTSGHCHQATSAPSTATMTAHSAGSVPLLVGSHHLRSRWEKATVPQSSIAITDLGFWSLGGAGADLFPVFV